MSYIVGSDRNQVNMNEKYAVHFPMNGRTDWALLV